MSRIGKKAVPVPAGVTASVNGQTVSVKGPKGELKVVLNDQVLAKMEQGGIRLTEGQVQAGTFILGMSRTLVANLVTGVTVGYSKSLEITGVGYRAALNGKALQLNLGYSHDVTYDIPPGIEIKVPKPTEIVISGIDKQRVARLRLRSVNTAAPSPTRARASNTQASTSSARKARRNNWWYKWLQKSLHSHGAQRASARRWQSAAICVRGFRCSARARTFMHRSSMTRKA